MDKMHENIKKYYESKSLPDEKVALLTGKNPNKRFGILGKFAVAAVALLALSFALQHFYYEDLEDRVVKEIAMNHSKGLRVEYTTESLKHLQSQLDKLDFSLLGAEEFLSGKYALMGGRYCSIQGNLAAQLKIKNTEDNNIETLYVTGLNEELDKIKPVSVNYNGSSIKLWKKEGRLYGIASDN